MSWMEKALRQDIETLQADKAHIGGRVEALEATVEDITPTLQALQTHCKIQDQLMNSLLNQRDDVQNCSHRINIGELFGFMLPGWGKLRCIACLHLFSQVTPSFLVSSNRPPGVLYFV